MSVPIALMVDDPAPLINVYWWHAAEHQQTNHPVLGSGEPVVKAVPADFLDRFAEVIERRGMRGKFSVLPYPAGLGAIGEGWPGCDRRALSQWIETARRRVMPLMDITPEILTHAKAVDLTTFGLLDENERDWSSHQTEATLTPYIAAALRLLGEVGLGATGVTSPWDFGIQVEDDYRLAIRRAIKQVTHRGRSWYFLHTDTQATALRSSVAWSDGDEWLVSIVSQCGDHLWKTMDSQDDSPAYIASVADRYLTEDGGEGRLAELFRAGTPMVFHTHWQSLYSNGRGTGLRVLDEVGRRIACAWGSDVRWIACSALAAEVAAGETQVDIVP